MRSLLAIFIGITIQLVTMPDATKQEGRSYYAVTNIGNPTQASYTDTTPRNPWDMVIYNGVLYIGAGDYGENTGDTPIYGYDLEAQSWSITGTVADEAVSNFVLVGEELYAPGTDPTADTWAYGNYHQLTDTGWITYNDLPEGVHNFDIIQYGGAMFYGIGTATNAVSPVKISTDGGETYEDVAFYKNGQSVLGLANDSFHRVYNFFVASGELYCLLVTTKADGKTRESGFFQYSGEYFDYVSSPEDFDMKRYDLRQVYLAGSVTAKESCYFSSGYLYKTEDFKNFTQLTLPDESIVTDLVEDRDYVYVLSSRKESDGTYFNGIWQLNPKEDTFTFLTSVETQDGFALSLAKQRNTFYVGIGHGENAGTVLQIQPRNAFTRMLGILPRDTVSPTEDEALS